MAEDGAMPQADGCCESLDPNIEKLAQDMVYRMRRQLDDGLNRRFWVSPDTPLIVIIRALELLYGPEWQEVIDQSDVTSLFNTYSGPAIYLRADPAK